MRAGRPRRRKKAWVSGAAALAAQAASSSDPSRCDRVRPWQFRQCVGVFYSAGIGMCAMRQAPSMAGMRRIALWGAAARPIIRGRWRCPVVASPQIKRPGAASCSPLEGDCRPSRAGMTEPGPQGPGFFICKDHGRTPLAARSLAAERLRTRYRPTPYDVTTAGLQTPGTARRCESPPRPRRARCRRGARDPATRVRVPGVAPRSARAAERRHPAAASAMPARAAACRIGQRAMPTAARFRGLCRGGRRIRHSR